MSFTPEFLDEVRARIGLADLIGRRVKLVRRGREHTGLCPFHSEKTPSFTVSEDKGFFHCFGCGAHGTAFDFVMRTEGLSFPEAVERLATEAGLPIPATSPEERRAEKRRATLAEACEAACAWFARQLSGAGGARARAYLAGRGLGEATIARFRLGFAPDAPGALRRALLSPSKGGPALPEELLVEAGLLIRRDDGSTYDRFRGRVMFPIADARGRVVAFGGRVLEGEGPKYLNSPETPLFHKGRLLYGLATAREPARARGRVIVVEGYTDVIALAQAGIEEAVAPLGTALTESQILSLWRLAPEPVLCFDGDAAGERAAARAAERALPALKPGCSLQFVALPAGEDPDSLVRRGGAAAFEDVVAGAVPLAEKLWQIETLGRRLDTPERRAGLEQRLEAHTLRISDRKVQAQYRATFRERIWHLGRRAARPAAPSTGSGRAGGDTRPLRRRPLQVLLAAAINHPALIDGHAEDLARLAVAEPALERLRQAVLSVSAACEALDSAALKRQLIAGGHASALESVLHASVYVHAGFARPDATFAAAEAGFRQTLQRHLADTRRAEIEEAERAYVNQPSEENWARLTLLKSEGETGGAAGEALLAELDEECLRLDPAARS